VDRFEYIVFTHQLKVNLRFIYQKMPTMTDFSKVEFEEVYKMHLDRPSVIVCIDAISFDAPRIVSILIKVTCCEGGWI